MNTDEKRFDWGTGSKNHTQLLRVGVIFLSVVSFFTTANGMSKYIFNDNVIIAYAASAAIQGILLALSMNLPEYLHNIWKKSRTTEEQKQTERFWGKIGKFCKKLLLCVFVILLTFVTIFCSSWFSYIYIAETVHQDSWGTDSELLVQQTYRTELYDARDYAHAYRIYLEDNVGKKILQLEYQTIQLSDSDANLSINWEEEKNKYVSDGGTSAASYMATVIEAMEKAMPNSPSESASQEDRDLAAQAIADAKANMENRIENIQQNQGILDANITNYENQIARLQNQINRGTDETNAIVLSNSISNYTGLIAEASQRQIDLQTESMQLDEALERLPFYESQLGLSSSTSAISIRVELLKLQSEFFAQEPDEEKLLNIATDIFTNLRNAVSKEANGEDTEDQFSNTKLLVQMNQLIQNLKDYSEIKGIESNLDKQIAKLRYMEDMTESELPPEPEETASPMEESVYPTDENESNEMVMSNETVTPTGASEEPPAPTKSVEPTETVAPTDAIVLANSPASSAQPDDQTETATPTSLAVSAPTGEEESAISEESTTPTSLNESDSEPVTLSLEEQDNQWKSNWKNKLTELKSQIGAMPIYSAGEDSQSEADGVLLESQTNILLSYDREKSNQKLDEMIRRYISDHNAIYQGIIYLQSPYRSLAIFALVLALSFDLSGFIFGFVVLGNSPSDEYGDAAAPDPNKQTEPGASNKDESGQVSYSNSLENKESDQTMWSILKTLNQYIVLTGDYESRDGNYYYKTFKDGLLYHWAVKDTVPYTQGIYIREEINDEWSKGKMLPKDGQELLFSRQPGGPKDGIYMDCQLVFEEGSLILFKEGQQNFLTSIDEYVPVHSYNPNKGENRTIPVNQLIAKMLNDQLVVVALNTKGTRVAAIYIVEQS